MNSKYFSSCLFLIHIPGDQSGQCSRCFCLNRILKASEGQSAQPQLVLVYFFKLHSWYYFLVYRVKNPENHND